MAAAGTAAGSGSVDQAQPVVVGPIAGQSRIRLLILIVRLVPRTAQDVPAVPHGIGAPFLDVARHVERAVRADAQVLAGTRRALAAEVAPLQDRRVDAHPGGQPPVVHGRQRLAGKLRVRRGLVPADAADRPVVLALRIRAELPGRGARASGRVAEFRDGLLPRDRAAVRRHRLAGQYRAVR